MRHILSTVLFILPILYCNILFGSTLKVVTTIKPIHSLVSSVTDGILTPDLLFYHSSLQNYILKPSDARYLAASDVIFYIDDHLETFVSTFAKTNKKIVELSHTVNLLPNRKYFLSQLISTMDSEKDLNFWLNPENAKNMIYCISATLSELDSENAYKYHANALKMIKKIDQEAQKIMSELESVMHQKYIVTNDTYQYFEQYFRLNSPSAILDIDEDAYLGVKSIIKIKRLMTQENIKCIFSNSWDMSNNIKPKILSQDAKIVILDSMGFNVAPGKDAYLAIMNGIAREFRSCFVDSLTQCRE
ncbi:metal ABC transporter solute-binding protein, Zn/Mn family [Wolbachia endosymbiont of Howardula sp.]|uniref:metal ABC transporter solute-binding protein, Zn/Mn family n=1 Tax=Wolbachia endosymbiont of Howardula sp. TaxID=2916816 RepID=UPI00217E2AD5|nr:zinc ABC transporter substrate-binding protein [Wolbachia endosymbiont of Howardula sp.]UWI83025.1 zinc ABC transporter substrate-binding protein [Wolbachia endosymbiont of Howardula sp.]